MSPNRIANRALQALAKSDRPAFDELARHLEPFPLHHGTAIGSPRVLAEHTYFVDSGIVSLVATTQAGESVGVALIGREGVAGVTDALGSKPFPYGLVVQLPGLAYRAPKALIREHIFSCSGLHELLMDHSQQVTHQLAQSALCNRFHTAVQRLARWLLLIAERADTNRFELTHEFVAQMVGAPRPVVSEAAATLRDARIIDYRRGLLTILNSKRLQKIACECFDALSQASNGAYPATTSSSRQKRSTRKGRGATANAKAGRSTR